MDELFPQYASARLDQKAQAQWLVIALKKQPSTRFPNSVGHDMPTGERMNGR